MLNNVVGYWAYIRVGLYSGGLIFGMRWALVYVGGLYSGGLIFGGAYSRRFTVRFTTSRTFVAGIRLNVRVLINKRLRPRMPSLLTSHATNAREVVKYFSVWRSSGHGVTWRVNQQVEMTIFFIWHSCIAFHFISKRASEHSPMSYIGCRI